MNPLNHPGFLAVLAAGLALGGHAWGGPTPGLPDPTDPVAGMGVNIHFTDPRPGELEMLACAGFHWVRMDFAWAATEKTSGAYDFSAYDRLLTRLDEFHIRALLILDYENQLYDNGLPSHTPAGRAAFARWAGAAAAHFKGRGVVWEIWNEPNGAWFWKPQPSADDYAKLALAVNRSVHDAAPGELVVGPALSGTNLAFVDVAARAGVLADWAGITIHPYLRGGPEHYVPAYGQTRQLIKQYAGDHSVQVLCGESGYSSIWEAVDEPTQGQYLARLFLLDVMAGVPLTIWYDWHDDGTNPKDPEHHFGIVRNEYYVGRDTIYDPKPAYYAAQTYARELAGLRFDGRKTTVSGDDFVLSFKGRQLECLVAWTAGAPHDVTIPAPAGIYTVSEFDGKPAAPAKADGGTLTLKLSGGPKYLKRK
jgi:hypothetical protein